MKLARGWVSFVPVLATVFGCSPDRGVEDVTPRERLCVVEGWTREYFRSEFFMLEGVAVSVDKDIGLPETTVHSDARGRVLLWDAKCGSRPYTLTAVDALGRQLALKATQPADLGPPREGLLPKYRRYPLSQAFTFPISAPTVEQLSVEIVAYQTTEAGAIVDLVTSPARVGRDISILVRYELLPNNVRLTIDGETVSPRFLGDVKATRIREGVHEYRHVPTIPGEHEVRLISYYDDVGLRHVISFRAE